MTPVRSLSLLFFGSLLGLLVPSCFTVGDDDSASNCKRGAKGCECKSNDTCNAGLTCDTKGHCVEHGAAGQGGSAGATSGKSSGGSGGLNPYARAGSHAGGKGGASSKGGTGGNAGEAGVGGEGAGAGEGGASHVGGSGGKGGSAGKAGTGGSAGKAGTGGMAGGGGCTAITLSGLYVDDTFAPDEMEYQADSAVELGDASYPDEVYLDVFAGFNGAQVGTFQLGTGDDANLDKCGRCLILRQDPFGVSEKFFFAAAGTLTFASDSKQMKGYPHGTLRNVTLREATYTTDTYHSTFVANGACVTIANADLLVNIDPPVTGWVNCPSSWYGDGSVCDCGCGALDADCTSADVSACDECYCSDDINDCTAVSSSENGVCN